MVETASLAAVEPPDISYQLHLDDLIRDKLLSGLQLESIVYACQRHDHLLPDQSRAGFFIGDGAGVGKGRTIAGWCSSALGACCNKSLVSAMVQWCGPGSGMFMDRRSMAADSDNVAGHGSLLSHLVPFCLEHQSVAMRNAAYSPAVQQREQVLPDDLYDLMSHIQMRSVGL